MLCIRFHNELLGVLNHTKSRIMQTRIYLPQRLNMIR